MLTNHNLSRWYDNTVTRKDSFGLTDKGFGTIKRAITANQAWLEVWGDRSAGGTASLSIKRSPNTISARNKQSDRV